MVWIIEARGRHGFWSAFYLAQSDLSTGFHGRIKTYASMEDAEAAVSELIAVGWKASDLRIVQSDNH